MIDETADETAERLARTRDAAPDLYASLNRLVEIIEMAGLINLRNGVQLGPTVWFVDASDRMGAAHRALAKARGE